MEKKLEIKIKEVKGWKKFPISIAIDKKGTIGLTIPHPYRKDIFLGKPIINYKKEGEFLDQNDVNQSLLDLIALLALTIKRHEQEKNKEKKETDTGSKSK